MSASGDYISREAAIDAVCKDCCLKKSMACHEQCNDIDNLKSIPAADVRPVVRAHWTDHRTIEHDGEWYCSACGKEITIYMGADRPDRYRFCPNCGADMRAES